MNSYREQASSVLEKLIENNSMFLSEDDTKKRIVIASSTEGLYVVFSFSA